jgi:hypothetical protein
MVGFVNTVMNFRIPKNKEEISRAISTSRRMMFYTVNQFNYHPAVHSTNVISHTYLKRIFLRRCQWERGLKHVLLSAGQRLGLDFESQAVHRLHAAIARGNVRCFASQSRYHIAASCRAWMYLRVFFFSVQVGLTKGHSHIQRVLPTVSKIHT